MELLLQWALLATVQAAATISPGPAFAMTVRNAVSGDRKSGILTALGLGLGVGTHVLFVLFGISVLVSNSHLLYNIIKYAGAAYLIFIGLKSVLVKPNKHTPAEQIATPIKKRTNIRRIQNGFLTNLLNPKALVFFTAVYAQFITPGTPWIIAALFCATSMLIETGWFSIVTIFLTSPKIRQRFMSISHWIERISGGLLIALGLKLAINKI